jgi:Ca-activated chloride channel homolog
MNAENKTGIQISHKPGTADISIVGGGIKINASAKPISSQFATKWGWTFVLLDCSGSMKGPKLDQAKKGMVDFARDAFKKQYQVGFIKFSTRAELLCDPTNDIAILQNKIKDIRADGSTNMTEAIKIAYSKLVELDSTKVIVIATDGMPDHVRHSLEEADKAKAAGIDIIAIGTDDADQKFLQKLASKTELSSKVSPDMLAQAITAASSLLMSPRSINLK